MSSRKEQKERARQARLAREAELAAAARRTRLRTLAAAGGSVVAAAIIIAIVLANGGAGSRASQTLSKLGSTPQLKLSSLTSLGRLKPAADSGSLGPEGIPVPAASPLVGTRSMASGNTIDGIGCAAREQTLFHIHAHLTVFVDGTQRQIPYGIGITSPQVQNSSNGPFVAGGSCFYSLHTHAADGIIHIESPVQRTYTLADFFDIWGQPLGPDQLGPVTGRVIALYDGRRYDGNPRDIPLNAHAQIQLEVGRPLVAPVTLSSWGGL